MAMADKSTKIISTSNKKTMPRVIFISFVIILMSNLNAVIDLIFHPEIPYFHEEHLIVGAITAVVTAILMWILLIYIQRLEDALQKIKVMEGLLPICSSCKKIRVKDNNWDVLEEYITERTNVKFTHSLCPDCMKRLYDDINPKSAIENLL